MLQVGSSPCHRECAANVLPRDGIFMTSFQAKELSLKGRTHEDGCAGAGTGEGPSLGRRVRQGPLAPPGLSS